MNLDDMRRYRLITEYEYKQRKEEERRKTERQNEECKKNMTICAQLVFCWICASGCFESQPKKVVCAASLSGMQYGGILIGYSAANSSSLGLGIGIPAVILGTITAVGLSAHELEVSDCCRESVESSASSAPVEVQPGLTVGPPAIISQPR